MQTARQVFEHIAATLNSDAEDGVMSTTLDDELISYLDNWKNSEFETAIKSICHECSLLLAPGCRIAGLGVTAIVKVCPKFKA